MEKGNYRGETGLLKKHEEEAKSFLPVYSNTTFMQPQVQGSRAEAWPSAGEQGREGGPATPTQSLPTTKGRGNSTGLAAWRVCSLWGHAEQHEP